MPTNESNNNNPEVERTNAALDETNAKLSKTTNELSKATSELIETKQSLLQTLGYKRDVANLKSLPVLEALIDEQKFQNAEAIKNQAPANPIKTITKVETTEEETSGGKKEVKNKLKFELPDGKEIELEPAIQKLNYFNVMHLISPNRVPREALVLHKEGILNMHPPTVDCPHPFMIA
jgi:hypothetical protein